MLPVLKLIHETFDYATYIGFLGNGYDNDDPGLVGVLTDWLMEHGPSSGPVCLADVLLLYAQYDLPKAVLAEFDIRMHDQHRGRRVQKATMIVDYGVVVVGFKGKERRQHDLYTDRSTVFVSLDSATRFEYKQRHLAARALKALVLNLYNDPSTTRCYRTTLYIDPMVKQEDWAHIIKQKNQQLARLPWSHLGSWNQHYNGRERRVEFTHVISASQLLGEAEPLLSDKWLVDWLKQKGVRRFVFAGYYNNDRPEVLSDVCPCCYDGQDATRLKIDQLEHLGHLDDTPSILAVSSSLHNHRRLYAECPRCRTVYWMQRNEAARTANYNLGQSFTTVPVELFFNNEPLGVSNEQPVILANERIVIGQLPGGPPSGSHRRSTADDDNDTDNGNVE